VLLDYSLYASLQTFWE